MFSRIKKLISDYGKIKWLAYHDSLTELRNRNWLFENVDRIDCDLVYFIDINGLHDINKKHGHLSGDEHIKKVVEHITDILEEDDILVRFAGDEFIVFARDFRDIFSCDWYCVGLCDYAQDCGNSLIDAIRTADMDMLEEKKLYGVG